MTILRILFYGLAAINSLCAIINYGAAFNIWLAEAPGYAATGGAHLICAVFFILESRKMG